MATGSIVSILSVRLSPTFRVAPPNVRSRGNIVCYNSLRTENASQYRFPARSRLWMGQSVNATKTTPTSARQRLGNFG